MEQRRTDTVMLVSLSRARPTDMGDVPPWPREWPHHSFFCCWLLPSASSGSSDEVAWDDRSQQAEAGHSRNRSRGESSMQSSACCLRYPGAAAAALDDRELTPREYRSIAVLHPPKRIWSLSDIITSHWVRFSLAVLRLLQKRLWFWLSSGAAFSMELNPFWKTFSKTASPVVLSVDAKSAPHAKHTASRNELP
jgi:hypothetical protein